MLLPYDVENIPDPYRSGNTTIIYQISIEQQDHLNVFELQNQLNS